MNTLEAIAARKSTRAFTQQPVEKEKLEQIVKAGNSAAIAGILGFSVITNAEVINNLQITAKNVMLQSGNDFLIGRANTPGFEVLYNAPAAIVIFANAPQDAMAAGTNAQNAGCAAENILLAATELGVASCYTVSSTLGFMVPGMKEIIGIDADKEVICVIALGYAAQETPQNERKTDNIIWCE